MVRRIALAAAVLAAAVLVWSVMAIRSADPVAQRTTVEFSTTTSPSTSAPATVTSPSTTETTVPNAPVLEFSVGSGRFEEVAVQEPGRNPVRITIDDLAIDAPINPVGVVAATKEMEVPNRHDLVGWYRYSPVPGSPAGSSVLAAHVDYNGRPGVFFELGTVEPGALIAVEFDDGTSEQFEVISGRQYDKDALPVDAIFAKSGDPVLTLITCGGAFDSSDRSYEDNVVIYAIPIESGFDRS